MSSRSHVPDPWGELMIDPHGPIIDFYPVDFKIDLNGKKYVDVIDVVIVMLYFLH
jgi:5'-3' exoribonuclease 2